MLLVEDVLELPVVDLENLPELDPVLVGFIITLARIWRVEMRAVRIWQVSGTTGFLLCTQTLKFQFSKF